MTRYEHFQRLGLEFLSIRPARATDESFQDSRMREICTSGSTMEQQLTNVSPAVLRYWPIKLLSVTRPKTLYFP
jgi:hypothetical protein